MNKELLSYISQEVDMERVSLAIKYMDIQRAPLSVVDERLFDQIYDLLEDYGEDNGLSEGWWMSEFEIDDVILQL